jgi:hypothetical protein
MPVRRSKFFLIMSVLLLIVVLSGFSRTFYLRALFDVPPLPAHVYVHGTILTSWFIWLVLQTSLVAAGRTSLHRTLGLAGAVTGLAVIVANVAVLANLGPRLRIQLADGLIEPHFLIRAVIGDFGSTLEFALFLLAGLWFRKRPDLHKRLMLLASVSIVGQALGRISLWPGLACARAGIGIGGLVFFLGALTLYDLMTGRRLQPVTFAGTALSVFVWAASGALAASRLGAEIVRGMAR